jgi:hypothetical protein
VGLGIAREADMPNRPKSMFSMGQRVQVRLKNRRSQSREITIRDILWHFQDEHYNYYLEENGRKDLKSYSEEDLESVE